VRRRPRKSHGVTLPSRHAQTSRRSSLRIAAFSSFDGSDHDDGGSRQIRSAFDGCRERRNHLFCPTFLPSSHRCAVVGRSGHARIPSAATAAALPPPTSRDKNNYAFCCPPPPAPPCRPPTKRRVVVVASIEELLLLLPLARGVGRNELAQLTSRWAEQLEGCESRSLRKEFTRAHLSLLSLSPLQASTRSLGGID
jgi:hypothetical protein